MGIIEPALALGARAAGADMWANGKWNARIPIADIGESLSPFPYILMLGQDDTSLTDFERSVMEPLLPMDWRGPKPKDNRKVLNGIFWVLRAGAPWRDLPERYGPYPTAYNRFNRWRKAGIWDHLMDAVVKAQDGPLTIEPNHHSRACWSIDDDSPIFNNSVMPIG